MYGIYEVHSKTQKCRLLAMRPTEQAAATTGRKLIEKKARRYRRRYAITIQMMRAPEALEVNR